MGCASSIPSPSANQPKRTTSTPLPTTKATTEESPATTPTRLPTKNATIEQSPVTTPTHLPINNATTEQSPATTPIPLPTKSASVDQWPAATPTSLPIKNVSAEQSPAAAPTRLPTENTNAELKSLCDACRFGDVDRVNDLLQTATLREINEADMKTGDTPLHLATRHGWLEIVRLLLSFGAARNVLNHNKKKPADCATDVEMKTLFARSVNNTSKRFVWNDSQEEEIEWSQSATDSLEFCLKYDNGLSYIGSWSISKTVDAIQQAPELNQDTSLGMKSVWDFLYKARQTNDVTYLVRAYTVESSFFRILNRKLSHRRLEKSEDEDEGRRLQLLLQNSLNLANYGVNLLQALTAGTMQTDHAQTNDWVHLYLGTVYTSLLQLGFQFSGRTYRGMCVNEKDLNHFSVDKIFICNKAITSTSTSLKVAKDFIYTTPPTEGQVPVMCVYTINSIATFKSFNIGRISEYPHEEEVIIFPGMPFEIIKVERDTTSNMITVELVSMLSDESKVLQMFKNLSS